MGHIPREQYALSRARSYARQLLNGEQVQHYGHHHLGMAKLKEWMGDPRPEGMTLSLVGDRARYIGRHRGKPYELSTSPHDYLWESKADNNKRRWGTYGL